MARPNGYSEIITKEILSRYSSGESLTKICRDEHLPERTTIYRWRTQYPEAPLILKNAEDYISA